MNYQVKNLIGQVFERLTVVSFSHIKRRTAYWKCLCVCGNTKVVRMSSLLDGLTKSCGCLNKEVQLKNLLFKDGRSKDPVYNRSRAKEYRKNNPGAWRKVDPKKTKNNYLKYRFGITLVQYDDMRAEQDYCCKLCGINESDLLEMSGKGLVVDHDHKTEIVRGLLCDNCNHGLGAFKDSLISLKNAILYLQKEK